VTLRARLVTVIASVALVALAAAGFFEYSALRSYLVSRVDHQLLAAERPLADALDQGIPLTFRTVEDLAPGDYVQVETAKGSSLFSIAAVDRGKAMTPRLPKVARSAGPGETVFVNASATSSGGPNFRVLSAPLVGGARLVLGAPLDSEDATLHRLFLLELAVGLAALLVASGLGWWLVRLGLKPLEAVEETAEAIADGDLERRVPGEEGNTETARVARALNVMLERIDAAFAERDASLEELRRSEERLRRFVADASHELRTPLAAVSAYAELFERGADRNPDDLARLMGGIRAESARMSSLVQDLLLLARLDEGLPLADEEVELVDLARESVSSARAVGPAWPVQLVAREAVIVRGDPLRLRQVLDNLLANVRAHTPEGTTATVTIGTEGPDALIEVSDNGPGMSPETAAKVFERFFRADPARTRRSGGAGLGLAIVAKLVEAHRGRVDVRSSEGEGTTFSVRLPRIGAEGAEAHSARDDADKSGSAHIGTPGDAQRELLR